MAEWGVATGPDLQVADVGGVRVDPVQQVVEGSIGGLDLRSSPETVAQGLATRLLRGDEASATNYLAYQAGITPAEASDRVVSFRQDVQNTIRNAGIQASRAMRFLGWTIFGATLIGAFLAMWGGMIGARVQIGETDSMRSPVVPTMAGRI